MLGMSRMINVGAAGQIRIRLVIDGPIVLERKLQPPRVWLVQVLSNGENVSTIQETLNWNKCFEAGAIVVPMNEMAEAIRCHAERYGRPEIALVDHDLETEDGRKTAEILASYGCEKIVSHTTDPVSIQKEKLERSDFGYFIQKEVTGIEEYRDIIKRILSEDEVTEIEPAPGTWHDGHGNPISERGDE